MDKVEGTLIEKNAPLIQYDPPQFLLNSETVDQIVNKYVSEKESQSEYDVEKERSISIGISFAVSLFCSFDTFLNIPKQTDIAAIIFYIIRILAMGAIAFWLVTCIRKSSKKKKELNGKGYDIRAEMKSSAKGKINYTAILIIALKDEEGVCKLFVDKRGKNDHAFFLPYCSMNTKDSIPYQSERIKSFVCSHYGLASDSVLDVIDLSEKPIFSIKATRSGISEEQHAFAFYRISLLPRAKKGFDSWDDGGWYTINDLKSTPQAVERNGDIINELEEHPEYIADSFEGERRPLLKIIWNITKTCAYDCEICATHDMKRKELSLKEKIRAFQSILTLKERIGLLDFAGGDPCQSEDSLLIVQEAVNALGWKHISVTTTGKGIISLDAQRRKNLLRQCEITLDAEHPNETRRIKRAASGYVETNIEQIVTYGDDAQNLTINMPIIHTDLSDEEIETIIQEVLTIKEANKNSKIHVSFLRLMPVGKASASEYPKDYLPWPVICKIRGKLEPHGIECTSHCSLNVCKEDERGSGCGRLVVKLGVDCSGNVFACAWAGYLPGFDDIEKNPFYIGNLLEMDLKDMLNEAINQNPNFKKMCKYAPKEFAYCPLISYVERKNTRRNDDPLSDRKANR